jgi:hypothetical protein
MAQALCENDHPLVTGESRCTLCGERIKMQWMSPRAVRDGSSTRPEPTVDRYTRKRLAFVLTCHVFTGLCFVTANWDRGLESWEWLMVAVWIIGIPFFIWDWRRDNRRAHVSEKAA